MRNNSLLGLLAKEKRELTVSETTYVNYYTWLKGLCLAMFEWKGLPPTVDARYLERALFEYGKALYFNDPLVGDLCLKCNPDSDLNVYSEPVRWKVNGHRYDKTIMAADAVLIRNNDMEEPTMWQVLAFAGRLTKTERTIDINLDAQKTPILIIADDKQKLTMKNLYKNYSDGAPVIYGNKSLIDLDTIKVLRTDAPYIIDKLDIHKQNLFNEALTFLGISNANTDKRERLITDEVLANEQHVELNAQTMLESRKKAAKAISKMFGVDVSVEMRKVTEDDVIMDDRIDEEDQDDG